MRGRVRGELDCSRVEVYDQTVEEKELKRRSLKRRSDEAPKKLSVNSWLRLLYVYVYVWII